MKFRVETEIIERFNPINIGIVVCKDINNSYSGLEISEAFSKEKDDIIKRFDGVELALYPIFQKWRQIYKSFGEKKNRCSIEALIRRTINGKEIPEINPLVDIYNTASIKFELPCGGEDLKKVSDDIVLGLASGEENFLPLGSTTIEHPSPGEIVYKSSDTILCGSFNYRESDLTKLTPETKDAVLVVESVLEEDNIKLSNMLNYLKENVEKYLGGNCEVHILNKNTPEVNIGNLN